LDARDQAIEAADDECQKFVNSVAAEQQATVAGVQQLSATLALLPDVQARNVPATDYLLSDLRKKNPLYSVIVISDKSGLIWASSTPLEEKISAAGRRYFEEAVRSGAFSSGEYSVGRIAKKPVMTFAQPVTNATNELTDVIAVSLKLDHFQFLFEKINLPEGSSFSLLDHKGVILHRNSEDPLSEQLVGKRDNREELFTKMAEGPDEGTYEAIGNDGKVRLTAYKKLRLPHESQPYLYIRSSIPKASVISKANATMFRNMAALMSIFAVGLTLAAFIGRHSIVDPIEKLKEASRQLAADPTPVNISEKVKDGELGELAHAFDDMAETLLRKEKEQLAAEEELRQKERLLQNVIDGSTSPIFLKDLDGRFITINTSLEKMLGISRDELRGKTDYDIAPKEVADHWMAHDKRVVSTGKAIQIEEVADLPDGHHIFLANKFPLVDGDGQTYGVGAISHDITDRKQAEQALLRSKELLSAVTDNSTDAIYVKDRQSKWLLANPALLHIVGKSAGDVLGRNDSEIYSDPAIGQAILENDRKIMERGTPESFEETAETPNGLKTFLSIKAPRFDEKGQIVGLVGISHDITDRKQAEEELRKAKDELEERVKERTYELYAESLYARSLIEASLDPLVTISVEGKITDVNCATEEVTGASREQLIGTDFSDYFTEPEKARAGYVEVFRQGFVRDYSLELKHRDGQVTPVLYNASVYRDKTGQIMGVFAAARDITERRQAEAALRKLAAELVMAEERERKRIAGVLHDEVAQTLAAAKMRIDMLQCIPFDQENKQILKEATGLLLQSIQETRALMNDIGNPLLFDMGLRDACVSLANRLMERHPVRVRCDIQDSYKHLDPDVKAMLYQMFRELLNNVMKHSQAQNAEIRIEVENGYFRLRVTDDGVGFDPDKVGTPSFEGGFGLYSIRERLISLGGSFKIESAPGTGTVVTAIIPAALD
jgi:PAS domain S-box-containing protein